MTFRNPSRTVAPVVGIALAVTMIVGAPIAANATGPHISPTLHRITTPRTPATHAGSLAAKGKPASSKSVVPTIADPPSPQSVSLPLSAAFQPVGTSGVSVAAAAASAGTVAVSILSSTDAHNDGLSGLVVKLSATGSTPTAVEVQVPMAILASEYGADYASRVRWVQVPAPATASKSLIAQSAPTAVTGSTEKDSMVLAPLVGAAPILLTAMSTPVSATGTGSFAATPLKPSSTWDVSAQTGDFSWSYAMRTPPAAAGPSPELGLQYSSQAVDGETGSTNNQSSVVGDGWELSAGGYIERSYVSCSQDNGASGAVTSSGDLCWKTDNATISVAGHSGELIKDQTTGMWKLSSDDGSRIEHLTGQAQGCGVSNGTYDDDCWRMTTTDGTQYYFGLDKLPGWSSGKATTGSAWTVPVFGNDPSEPCHATTFAASSCVQAWRWNLDYVVDTHSNAEALYYDQQTNSYSQNGGAGVSYVRGGELNHIDYGMSASGLFATNAASDRVVFGYDSDGRCSDATGANCSAELVKGNAVAPANPSYYPDTPFDQLCSSASCPNLLSPTFWSTSMLTKVTTKYFDAASTSYLAVDRWDLQHSFPNPGDGSSAALWLTRVTHTGISGDQSIAEPPTTFAATMMQNRVWMLDGLAALDKERLSSITSPTGATTAVNYTTAECTPQNAAAIMATPATNTHRCFPQWWTADTVHPHPAQQDLFNVYVVTSVISDPVTGGGGDRPIETYYSYPSTGVAWRYNTSPFTPDAQRTWSVFAGYDSVEVTVGSPSQGPQQTTDYTFFRGLDQDHTATAGQLRSATVTGYPTVTDSLWLAGQTLDTKVRLGVGGAVLSDTVTTPWASAVTANDGTHTARMVAIGDTTSTVPLSTGGTRTTETKTTFDPTYGLPLTVDAITPDAGTTCTTTSYATPNVVAWLIAYPKEMAVVAADCSAVTRAVYPAASISDTRTSYDQGAWGAMPTHGDPTTTSVVDGYKGTTAAGAKWVTANTYQYDAMGRVLKTTDVLGHSTTTAYSPATASPDAGALTSEVSTNALNWSTTTNYNPAWGVETMVVDANGKSTEADYDALGRRTQVWLPLNPRSDDPRWPSISYDYTESNTAASSVETSVLSAQYGPTSSFTLYDGLGRQVQTQTEGINLQDSDVSDTRYDSAGRVVFVDGPYETGLAASATLIVPTDQRVLSQTLTRYDADGRVTASILESGGSEISRTSTAYNGADRVDVTPPSGGTPTTTMRNSLGQTVSLTQYLGAAIAAGVATEKTNYSYNPQGSKSGMTDPAGNRWTWGFDVLGHQITATDPDTGTTKSTYDDAGELLTSTDGRGQTLAYSYDSLGRKTAEYSGASAAKGSLLAFWSFDTLAKGQLTSSSSYIGSKVNKPGAAYTESVTGYDAAYDPTGTVISIPSTAPAFGGTTYETDLDYYVNGQVEDQIDPAEGDLPGETLEYGYADFGNIDSLNGLSLVLGGVDYTALHQVAQYDRLDGSVYDYTDFGYDPATGRTTNVINFTASMDGSNQVTQSNDIIDYNPAGNVTSETTTSDTTATDTQCFGYDPLQNLIQAWTPANANCTAAPSTGALGGPAAYWSKYTIDPATGNRLTATTSPTAVGATATTSTYAYPAAGAAHPHAVKSVKSVGSATTPAAYTYDKAGDTITRPGQKLTYDATGKLSTVTVGKTVQSNVYDASGTLLLQSDSTTGTTLFLGDTELHLAPKSTSATGVRTYTADGVPVAERDSSATDPDGTLLWLQVDQNNTPTMEINSDTGAVLRRYSDPFGNSRGTPVSWSSDHGYLNAPTSSLSSLTLLGAREYDPVLGRFLSVDSVLAPFNPAQNNGYSYSGNSPVTHSDPSGLMYIGAFGGGAGVSPPATSTPAPKAAGNSGGSTKSKVGTKSSNPNTGWSINWQDVGAIAAGIGVGLAVTAVIVGAVACTAATFGVCGAIIIGAAVVGGAAGAAVTYGLQSGKKSWSGLGEATALGAAGGLVGGAVGGAISETSAAIASKFAASAAVGSSVGVTDRVVIGGMEHLNSPGVIGSGERTLLPQLQPDLGDPASNWARNKSVLLNEMARGIPIRDSSVDSDGRLLLEDSGRFIVKERNVLRANGWQYDQSTTLWSSPGK